MAVSCKLHLCHMSRSISGNSLVSTHGIQCRDYRLSQAELKHLPPTITCFKSSHRNIVFLWQHVNNDHHNIHIYVLSRSVFHIPGVVKHYFPALCKGVGDVCYLSGTTLGGGVYSFHRLKITLVETSTTCSLGKQSSCSWSLKIVLTHSEGARVRSQ